MSTNGGRRARTSRYRCTGCGVVRAGDVGLEWCPDCGCELRVIGGARETPALEVDNIDADQLMQSMFGKRPGR